MHAVRILHFLQRGFSREWTPVFYKYIEAGRESLEPELAGLLAAFDKHLEKEVEKWMPSFDEYTKEYIKKKNMSVKEVMELLFCHPDGSDRCYTYLCEQMELVKQPFLGEASLESSPSVIDAKSETKGEGPLQKSPASTQSGFFGENSNGLHSELSAALNAKPLSNSLSSSVSTSSERAVSQDLSNSNSSFGATDNGGQKEDGGKEGPGSQGEIHNVVK